MITASSLTPDHRGWFEPVVAPAPPDWPWALPHLYAVNVAPDQGVEIVGASASPDGTSSVREGWVADRTRIETVGYWHGMFGLVECRRTETAASALSQATDLFRSRLVRFLMAAGRVTDENTSVQVTGEWPARWAFTKLSDLGVFCAFVFEQLKAAGAGAAAATFKTSLSAAWPPTEQLLVFIRSMEMAQNDLRKYLDAGTRNALDSALAIAKGWLR